MKRADLFREIGREAKAQGLTFELLRSQGGHDVYLLDDVRLAI